MKSVRISRPGLLLALLPIASGACSTASPPRENTEKTSTATSEAVVSGATYQLLSVNSGLALDVLGASTAPGAAIDQWSPNGGTNQQWKLDPAPDGSFHLISIGSGLCLDVTGASTSPGALLEQWTCWDGPNQRWSFVPTNGGAYELVSENSGLGLDVLGASTSPGALLQQYPYWGGPNQQWQLVPVSGASPVASSGSSAFKKDGDNGTVDCDTFCLGSQWGQVGTCLGSAVTNVACDQALGGTANGIEQLCQCQASDGSLFTKTGNDGTASCDTFCAGAQWGQTGTCVSSSLATNSTATIGGASFSYQSDCSVSPGLLEAEELACICSGSGGSSAAPPAPPPAPGPHYAAIFYFTGFGDSLFSAANTSPTGDIWIMQGQSPPYGGYGTSNFWGKPAWTETGDGTIINNYRFYLNGDPNQPNTGLLDQHADLLTQAGIDLVVLDFTNGAADFANGPSYISGTQALCNRWQERMNEGLPVPKIAFFVRDQDTLTTVEQTYFNVYRSDLFFEYLGKKLLLVAAPDPNLGPGDPGQPAIPTAGDFANYTARTMWGLNTSGSTWEFKVASATPPPPFMYDGTPEEMSAPVATQSTYMTMDGVNPAPGAFGRSNGDYFTTYMNAAIQTQPTFVFIHSWNEWAAGNWDQANPSVPYFVDQWVEEYSSDIEPMAGGHGTQYYDLMKQLVAQFKAGSQ